MKKLSALLLTSAMVCGLSTGVYAKPIAITNQQLQNKLKIMIQTNGANKNFDWSSICKELGIDENNFQWNDCPIVSIPGFKPDTNKPNINFPDFDFPDNSTPDNDKPNVNPDDSQQGSESAYVNEVVRLVNEERAKAGLSPLSTSINMQKAAQVRAKEQQSSFSHTRPNGAHFSTALKENGVSYKGAGENIAYGQKTPAQVMQSWMNSQGHRANILNKDFTSIGVGYYVGQNGTAYWAQLFTY